MGRVKNNSQDSETSKELQHFKWSYADDVRFCTIAMCVGWVDVSPKHIIRFLPHIDRQVIASHLQKIRKDIKFVNGTLQNYDTPIHITHPNFQAVNDFWLKSKKSVPEEDMIRLIE